MIWSINFEPYLEPIILTVLALLAVALTLEIGKERRR